MSKHSLTVFAISAFLALSLVAISGCGDKETFAPPSKEDIAEARPLVHAVNHFGFSLLKNIDRSNNKNTVISPVSVHDALSLTAQGAAGSTQTQMRDALGLSSLETSTTDKQWSTLIAALKTAGQSDKKTARDLEIANSLWYQKGFTLTDAFKSSAQDMFHAKATPLDFAGGDKASKINRWISQHTDKKLTDVISHTSQDDLIYLVNALYFHDDWADPFKQESTSQEPFTKANGQTHDVAMMHKTTSLPLYQTDSYQATCLDYQDRATSLYLFLPTGTNDIEPMIDSLADGEFDITVSTLNSGETTEVALGLPKTKANFSADLVPALKSMGFEDMFDPLKANFSRMLRTSEGPTSAVYISGVAHATQLEIDEKGTTAAAATVVEGKAMAARPPENPHIFICDHPYVCALVDNTTGSLLFLGIIMDPVH